MPYLRSLSLFAFSFLSAAVVAGCSCSSSCDFPVMCVDHCGGTVVSNACGPCPSGSVPLSSCIDASSPVDASTDASTTDVGHDAPPPVDAGHDASDVDAALYCDRPGYPESSEATRAERLAVETAATAFTTETGVTVELDPSTAAVTGFSAPFPVTLDASITDPCARALDAIQTFFADHADLMRVPTDMTVRACDYDSLTDAEIVRLHGGTYDGRRIVGLDNDLLVHVARSGAIRYWAGSYLPVATRLLPTSCFDAATVATSLVGDSLSYTTFDRCVVGPMGSVPIRTNDTRTPGEPAIYVDAGGLVHVARQIEVLLAVPNVTSAEIGSDLFCCSGATVAGCVGSYVIVDEITLEILTQLPRCITC